MSAALKKQKNNQPVRWTFFTFYFLSSCVYSRLCYPRFPLHPHTYDRWSDGLLPGQRPPHDAPYLSSDVSAPRLRHQPGAHGGEAPDVVLLLLHLFLHLFLLPVLAQCNDPAQPLLLLPGEPVPLLTSDQLQLLPSGQQLLQLELPAYTQVGYIKLD